MEVVLNFIPIGNIDVNQIFQANKMMPIDVVITHIMPGDKKGEKVRVISSGRLNHKHTVAKETLEGLGCTKYADVDIVYFDSYVYGPSMYIWRKYGNEAEYAIICPEQYVMIAFAATIT